MSKKLKITIVQNAAGVATRVKIGDVEIPVQSASPIFGPGATNLVMIVENVEPSFEAEAKPTTA